VGHPAVDRGGAVAEKFFICSLYKHLAGGWVVIRIPTFEAAIFEEIVPIGNLQHKLERLGANYKEEDNNNHEQRQDESDS
jgi:hypothetical protein